MFCICCKKYNVVPMYSKDYKHVKANKPEEDLLWMYEQIDGQNINHHTIDGGIIQILDAGYGSNHDTNRFIIAICDKCISENLKSGVVLYYGDYMHSSAINIKERVEKSKKNFKRAKNLNTLI